MSPPPHRIAILGAESTGKTTLAEALAAALRGRGLRVATVAEYLREWCDAAQRTPQVHEQAAIADEQARRVLGHIGVDLVLADTTPLMTALYSQWLFGDDTLREAALNHQRLYDHTLITGLDLPWVADGLQRDGPQVREPVDRLLRAWLAEAGLPYAIVYGQGERRLANALHAIDSAARRADPLRSNAQYRIAAGRRDWRCEHCSDPECEHRLFSGLLAGRSDPGPTA